MTLNIERKTLSLVPVLVFLVAACDSGTSRNLGDVVVFTNVDSGFVGCSQPIFPSGQPDLSIVSPPVFVNSMGEPEPRIFPGSDLMAEIPVNIDTRRVAVEIRNAWAPEQMILSEDLDTTGNQIVRVTFFTDPSTLGRFYMRIILCGNDCNEREVIFDIIDPDPSDLETGINGDYERTVVERGEVVRTDKTCVRPNSVLIQ